MDNDRDLNYLRELMWVHAPYIMANSGFKGPAANKEPINDQEFEDLVVRLLQKIQMYSKMESGKRPE